MWSLLPIPWGTRKENELCVTTMDVTVSQADDMSNKNSAECDKKSECDCDLYSSEYWEEIVTHTNQDLLESDSESEFYVPHHHSSFEKEYKQSKLSEIVLFSENNQTNFKNCYKYRPLLQAQTLENTRQFQAELSPELSDHPSKAYSSKIFPYVCDGSCQDHLCLNSKIPHLIVAEKLDKVPSSYTVKELHATDKLHQKKQPVDDYPPTSIHNKASQISFLCRKEEIGGNISCECFKQSAIPDEVNKTSDRESIVPYSSESTCSKKSTSSQLVKEHLDCSTESSYKIGSSQTAEQTYLHASSAELTISLTLEAGTIDNIGSLAGDISPSKARVGKEDSQRHVLTFKFTDSEHNNLFNKLCISIIPSISYSAHLDTESQKQTTPFRKQTGLPETLADKASQPLATRTKSSESSSPDIPTDQVPSTLKQWSARQLLSHETQSSYLLVRSIPYHKAVSKAEVHKHQLKAFRPVKSAVFTKNKEVHKDKRCRNRPYITSKFNWPNTLAVEPFPYQRLKESAINELYYGPLIWATTTCHCSPLLDLTVDLLSERRYSSTEKFLRVHRKPHKQVGGGKVIPRFSSQYLLSPRSSFETLQYLFPIRKKNSLKMQSILTSCLGQAEGCNKHESYKGEVCSTLDNSNARGNVLFAPRAPADGRNSVTSPLGNSCIQLSPALPRPSERRHSPASFLQTQRDNLKLAGLCPDCKCRLSNSPYCAYIVNVVQPPKERNMANSLCMAKPNSGAIQIACEDLALKKFSVCPCGNVPQHGLFPSADLSWSDRKKTRASPDINQRASLTESIKVNSPKGTFSTVEACCNKCHHCSPTCFCFHNMKRQEASRNQFVKVRFPFENEFPIKNLKDFEEESKAVKKGERKTGRIHIGPDTLQEFGPSNTHSVPLCKDGNRTPKYVMYCPKCCSSCQTAVQHLGTSKEVHNSYSSEQKMVDNCLNRKSVFHMDPGQGTRSQCKCSQEISFPCGPN